MDLAPVRTHILLRNIEQFVNVDFLTWTTYLWTVFFKIDGDTVFVDENLMVQGKATVVGTQGNHGDLPGSNTRHNINIPIPSAIGEFRTVLTPIPIRRLGTTFPGTVGCITILLLQRDTPAGAVAKGHKALNSSLQHELDALISTLGPGTMATDADVKAIQDRIETAVGNSIKDALSSWDKILTFLNYKTQDSVLFTANYRFSQDQLIASPPAGIPLRSGYTRPQEGGTPIPNQQIVTWTLNGKLIADPLPLSMRRVVLGLGLNPPISLRAAMGLTPSVRTWIATVR